MSTGLTGLYSFNRIFNKCLFGYSVESVFDMQTVSRVLFPIYGMHVFNPLIQPSRVDEVPLFDLIIIVIWKLSTSPIVVLILSGCMCGWYSVSYFIPILVIYLLLLCSLWCVQIIWYIMALRSHSLARILFHLIIIIIESYIKVLSIYNVCQADFVECISTVNLFSPLFWCNILESVSTAGRLF